MKRVLVIGLGSIGQRHARNLRSILGNDLTLSALRSARDRAGVDRVVYDDMSTEEGDPGVDCDGGVFFDLAKAMSTKPDAVIIATPSSLHLDPLKAALLAGAAVFVEKPLSHSLEGVDEVMSIAERTKAIVAVGCQLRFHPALSHLKQLIEDGAVGRIIAVQAEQGEYLPSYHPYEDYSNSYAAQRRLGGGVVLTQIHELDYLQWLFGPPKSVYAVGGTVGDLAIDTEDSVTALLNCERDGKSLAVQLHLDYLQRIPKRTCVVIGDEGRIDVDLMEPLLTWTDSAGQVKLRKRFKSFARSQLFVEEMQDFLHAVDTGSPVKVSLSEAAMTLRTAMGLLESVNSGTVQHLA